MALLKFESMLKTNSVYFFDLVEFEEIILHYLDVGKHTLAKKAVQLGLEQHPTSVDLKLLQVELYLFEDKLDAAKMILKKIELLEPNNEEVYIQKATIDSKKGQHEKAIKNLKKALSFTNDKIDIWSLMGMEYLYIDDFKNARLNFEKCIEVDLEDYTALYNVVSCFDLEKNYEQAIEYLNSYINKNPYSEVAWHQLGKQYYTLNRFKEALTSFEYAILIDESFIGGYLEKAKTLEQLEKYQEAIESYLISLELDDPTAFVYLRIGECYQKLNQYQTAIDYYKKATHEDPLLDKAWFLLTNLYVKAKDYKKGSYYITKALKIDEDNPAFWKTYAEINIELNFFEEAVYGFEKCIILEDDDIAIYIALADVLTFLGNFSDALQILVRAQKKYKNFAEIEYRIAGIFFILQKQNYGITHLVNALKIDFECHVILKELFPAIFNNSELQKIIVDYKKLSNNLKN